MKQIVNMQSPAGSNQGLSPLFFCAILFVIGFCQFLYSPTETVFKWTTAQDIPYLLRMLDSSYLQNDFYTNAMMDSPRLFFNTVIYGITLLGVDWYAALYFMQVFVELLLKPLYFMLFYHVLLAYNDNKEIGNTIKFIIFFTVVFIAFFTITKWSQSPFGWKTMYHNPTINPAYLSYFIGLLYTSVFFCQNKLKHFSSLFLFIATLIHPIAGLCSFAFTFIFSLPVLHSKKDIYKYLQDAMIGIILPACYYLNVEKNFIHCSTDYFFEIYAKMRHPRHFLLSQEVDRYTIMWVVLLFLPLAFSFLQRNKKVQYITLFSFTSCLLAPLLQYLGTEVLPIKFIMNLGPSRFTGLYNIILIMNTLIVLCALMSHNIPILCSRLEKYRAFNRLVVVCLNKKVCLVKSIRGPFFLLDNILRSYKKGFFSISFISIILLTFYTITDPLDYYDKKLSGTRDILIWLKNETPQDSVIFNTRSKLGIIDNFLIRTYSERAITAEHGYPFNESVIEEFAERFHLLRQSKKYTPSDYACINTFYRADYVIMHNKSRKNFKSYSPIFDSGSYYVYDINSFTIPEQCNKDDYFKTLPVYKKEEQ